VTFDISRDSPVKDAHMFINVVPQNIPQRQCVVVLCASVPVPYSSDCFPRGKAHLCSLMVRSACEEITAFYKTQRYVVNKNPRKASFQGRVLLEELWEMETERGDSQTLNRSTNHKPRHSPQI